MRAFTELGMGDELKEHMMALHKNHEDNDTVTMLGVMSLYVPFVAGSVSFNLNLGN